VSRVLRGMARDFPRTTPSGFLGSCSPGKLRQTSGRLYSRGAVDGRRPITVGGGGGYLLMGKGKSQKIARKKKITQASESARERERERVKGGFPGVARRAPMARSQLPRMCPSHMSSA
jgi:hypothetical protein